MSVDYDLTSLCDAELKKLNADAERLARSGTQAQQAAAEAVLTQLAAEVRRRIETLEATAARHGVDGVSRQ